MFRKFLKGWWTQIVFLLKLAILIHFFYLCVVTTLTLYYKFFPPSISMLMVYRSFYDQFVNNPVQFIPLTQIHSTTRRAFIRLEDRGFYEHRGVSWGALREAFEVNQKHGKIIAGGSTITMQLAKNLFLLPHRNVLRKYLEIITAFVLELILGKDRILEIYLNIIEFGPGVYGLEAAARYHYNKSFHQLTQNQIFRLAALITNPLKYNVRNMVNSPSQMARLRFLGGN